MTILYPNRFREAQPAGFDGVFDWDFLKPCWAGTKISPMDFDAVVEANGHFLVFETKEPGRKIEPGQRMTLKCVSSLPQFTVMVLWAKRVEDIRGWEVWRMGEAPQATYEGTAQDLVDFVRGWFLNTGRISR